jgi:hypothetical protein
LAKFSQPPTLGEIIQRARRYGFTRHVIRVSGVGRIAFLRRGKKGRDAELVDLPPGFGLDD